MLIQEERMKISGKKTGVDTGNFVKNAGDKNRPNKTGQNAGASAGDSVALSEKARDINKVKKMIDSIPDIRDEMVVKLRTDIENGNYTVDAGKVAEKMIERALRNILNSR